MGRVFDSDAAAGYLALSRATLAKMRLRGEGPKFIKLTAHKIGYPVDALDAWIAAQLPRQSTSEYVTDGERELRERVRLKVEAARRIKAAARAGAPPRKKTR